MDLEPACERFQFAAGAKEIPIRLCLLVDGLDEFDGDHEDLAELFGGIVGKGSPGVKVCLSSRPLVVFKDTFSECPQLELQNFTFNDIKKLHQ
jgi:hypothetical protein